MAKRSPIRSLTGRARRAQLDGYLARVVDRDFDEWARSFVVHQRKVYSGDAASFLRLHPTSRDRAAAAWA